MPRKKTPTIDEHIEAGKILKQIRMMLIHARTSDSLNKVFTKNELSSLGSATRAIEGLIDKGDVAAFSQYSATKNVKELNRIYYGREND